MNRYADKTCSLECKGDHGPKVHEFVGPVRIIFVEPTSLDYYEKLCAPSILTFAYVLIILSVVIVICYTLTFSIPMSKNLHIGACMVGLHLLIPSGILMLDPMFGGGAHLSPLDKHYQHFWIQSFATIYTFVGFIHVVYNNDILTFHGVVGSLTALAVFGQAGLGVYALMPKKEFEAEPPDLQKVYIHKLLGMLILLMSLATLCTGVFRPEFTKWCYRQRLIELPYILMTLAFLYTMVIIFFVGWRIYQSVKDI